MDYTMILIYIILIIFNILILRINLIRFSKRLILMLFFISLGFFLINILINNIFNISEKNTIHVIQFFGLGLFISLILREGLLGDYFNNFLSSMLGVYLFMVFYTQGFDDIQNPIYRFPRYLLYLLGSSYAMLHIDDKFTNRFAMGSIQKLIMTKLEEICTELKMTFSTRQTYSNTGRIYIHDSDLNIRLAACFDFETDYYKFNWYEAKADQIVCGMVKEGHGGCIKITFLHYHQSDRMKILFQWFEDTLRSPIEK